MLPASRLMGPNPNPGEAAGARGGSGGLRALPLEHHPQMPVAAHRSQVLHQPLGQQRRDGDGIVVTPGILLADRRDHALADVGMDIVGLELAGNAVDEPPAFHRVHGEQGAFLGSEQSVRCGDRADLEAQHPVRRLAVHLQRHPGKLRAASLFQIGRQGGGGELFGPAEVEPSGYAAETELMIDVGDVAAGRGIGEVAIVVGEDGGPVGRVERGQPGRQLPCSRSIFRRVQDQQDGQCENRHGVCLLTRP